MVFDFPKNIKDLDVSLFLDDDGKEKFYFSLSKGCFFINSPSNSLIAQAFATPKGVRITLTNSFCFDLTKNGDSVDITEPVLDDDEKVDSSFARVDDMKYFVFGKPATFCYSLYCKSNEKKNPKLCFEAVARPLYPRRYLLKTEQDENMFVCILFAVGISMLYEN